MRQATPLAVVVTDQVMPGGSGVDLLKRLHADIRFNAASTCLLTGQATHADTIEAINVAQVGRYVEKPWSGEQLRRRFRPYLPNGCCTNPAKIICHL